MNQTKTIGTLTIIFLLFTFCSYSSPNVGRPASPLPLAKRIKLDFSVYLDNFYTADYTNSLRFEQSFANLAAMIEDNVSNRQYRRTMLHLLRVLKLKKAARNKKTKTKLYNDLAGISARMKLYPLAMQFCQQEMQEENNAGLNDSEETKTPDTATDFNELDTSFSFPESSNNEKSKPVTADEIIQSFDDAKEASEYALIIHVKQPVNGKRKAFTKIDNVGHMFITLIKYNSDQTYVSKSFGFYPNKNGLLAATPLQPGTSSTFKDDALHDWDEAVGKFISYRRFFKIIKLLTRYEYKPYHLNENNCTDFGLSIASLSGIRIKETIGKWPFGKGNNPANAGQSILENKLSNEMQDDSSALFVFKK